VEERGPEFAEEEPGVDFAEHSQACSQEVFCARKC